MGLITVDEFARIPIGLKGPKSIPEADHLQALIETASTAIEDFCQRRFASQEHVEVLRGRDSYRLILGEFPLTGLTSVAWEDDSTATTGTIDTALLRVVEDGWIEFKRKEAGRSGYVYAGPEWFDAGRTYTITYTAGYATIPGPIKHAVALQVAELLQPNFGGASQEVPELVPLSSQLIVDLLNPKYTRKMKRA